MSERRSGDYRRPRPGPGPAPGERGGSPPPGAGSPGPRALAPRAPRSWLRLLAIVAGFLLLAVGVVGLVLPFLQGVLLILAGLAVLGREFPWARRVTNRISNFVRRRAAGRRAKRGGPAGS